MSTVEGIVMQTKIKGTRVLILDYGSTDGSIQYCVQKQVDLQKILQIEILDWKDKRQEFHAITPYCFWISPGVVLSDQDFLIREINKSSLTKKNIAFLIRNKKTFLKELLPHYYLNKGQLELSSLLCKSPEWVFITPMKTQSGFHFKVSYKITTKEYKFSRLKIGRGLFS